MNIHSAPPVVYPVGRSRFQRRFLLALWLSGLLCLLLWLGSTVPVGWHVALSLVVLAGAGVAAWTGWRRAPAGQLAWDGQLWRWESASYQTGIAEYELGVIADLQHLLMLRLENPASASLWLWVERDGFPERWLDLRRAVYSPSRASRSAPEQGLLAAEPSGAMAGLGFDDAIDFLPSKP